MKQMIKLGLILALYTSIACVTLAFVNDLTKDTIASAKDKELNEGLKIVFAQADSFEQLDSSLFPSINDVTIDAVYLAKANDAIIGSVIKASGATYNDATILVGITTESTMTSIEFLELTDTPGFGQKAKEPAFKDQFIDKAIDETLALGTNVDAISGSTITSRGIVKILNAAIESGKKAITEGAQ